MRILVCMCVVSKFARVYRVLLRMCICTCVFYTRVYATSRWCAFLLADH